MLVKRGRMSFEHHQWRSPPHCTHGRGEASVTSSQQKRPEDCRILEQSIAAFAVDFCDLSYLNRNSRSGSPAARGTIVESFRTREHGAQHRRRAGQAVVLPPRFKATPACRPSRAKHKRAYRRGNRRGDRAGSTSAEGGVTTAVKNPVIWECFALVGRRHPQAAGNGSYPEALIRNLPVRSWPRSVLSDFRPG